jgi:ABC-type multidrug transport system fused ATPase/permease subunit
MVFEAKELKITSTLKSLFDHIGLKRRMQLLALVLLMIIAALVEVISIGSVIPFLSVLMSPDSFYNNPSFNPIIVYVGITEPHQLLFPVTIIFIFSVVMSGLVRLVLLFGQLYVSTKIGADYGLCAYEKTIYQPYSIQIKRNSSSLISTITTKINAVTGTIQSILVIASSSIILLSSLSFMLYFNFLITSIVFGSIASIYILIANATKKKLNNYGEIISNENANVVKVLQESLGSIRDILINGTQSTYCKIFSETDLRLRKTNSSIQIIAIVPKYIIETVGMTIIGLIAYLIAANGKSVIGEIPALGALVICAQRMIPVLQQLYNSWVYIRSGQSTAKDVLDLLNQELTEQSKNKKYIPLLYQNSIELKNIGFRYSETSPWIIRNVNLEIKKGCKIGIIGATGSGKSTIVDVIIALLEPVEGEIKIDGIRVNKENDYRWQAQIAHVPQQIFLTDASVAENIAFGIEPIKIDYKRVREAARKANIEKAIEGWKDKYKTIVGERGVRLSGGQRQRLGIARALYKNANVLVFDEATSALDVRTENEVMREINKIENEITVIVIAHRMDTLKFCNNIIDVSNGAITIIR